MKIVKYIGQQQPQDIIEVSDEKALLLLARGDYILLDEEVAIVPQPEVKLGGLKPKELERVDEFAQDLKDDTKRNYSNRKKNNA